MTQTVVGVFATADAARQAERALRERGIANASLHLLSSDAAAATSDQVPAQEVRDVPAYLSRLFGTDNAQETDVYAEAIKQGRVMLTVDVADADSLTPVHDTLAAAGADDIGTLATAGERGRGK